LLGGEGLGRLARICHARARATASRLAQIPGVRVLNSAYAAEFTVLLPRDARPVVRAMADAGVLGGVALGRLYPHAGELHQGLLVTASECTTDYDIESLAAALRAALKGEKA